MLSHAQEVHVYRFYLLLSHYFFRMRINLRSRFKNVCVNEKERYSYFYEHIYVQFLLKFQLVSP